MAGVGIPEKLINFRVFEDGTQFLGVAQVELPQVQMMNVSIKGSGIAGEVESPVLGHTQSMTLKITFRTLTPEAWGLTKPGAHQLDFRAGLESYVLADGKQKVVPNKVWVRGKTKSSGLGKAEPGNTMDSEVEMEVEAIGVYYDGKEAFYHDKYNGIFRVDGTDYLQEERAAEGMEG